MKPVANGPAAARDVLASGLAGGRLFRKYVALFLGVVCLALVPNGLVDIWFSYQGLKTLLVRIQGEQAKSAAEKIGQFVKEIEGQMAWAIQLPMKAKTEDDWRFDAVRLLRQAPAVTEIAQLDATGHEQYRMSREAMDVIGSLSDFSRDPIFIEAMANRIYYGPVYFVRESEPYMTLALAGAAWLMSSMHAVASSRIRISALCCATPICPALRTCRPPARRGGSSRRTI